MATSLERLWGAFGGREASQRGPGASKRQPRRPKPCPWSAFGVPLVAGKPPEGGRELPWDKSKMGLPPPTGRCCALGDPGSRYTWDQLRILGSWIWSVVLKLPHRSIRVACALFSLRVFRLGLLRTRGLVAKCCAAPVWKPPFVLILGHWPHIGPVPGATLGCL